MMVRGQTPPNLLTNCLPLETFLQMKPAEKELMEHSVNGFLQKKTR